MHTSIYHMTTLNSMDISLNTSRKQCRLVLFPLPIQGHINPMFQLAKILHSRGFAISIIHTHYNFPDPSKYSDFTFHSIPDGLSESGQVTRDNALHFVNLLNTYCVEPFKRCLTQILSTYTKHYHVPCIVTDAMWYFTQAIADDLKMPRIVLRTTSVCSFLAYAALPLLHQKGYFTNIEAKLEEAVPEFPPLKVKDIPTVRAADKQAAFRALIDNLIGATKKASCLIFNTFAELESVELPKLRAQFPVPVFPIGPFHKRFSAASTTLIPPDRTALAWLDQHPPKSVLYVSFGSIAAVEDQRRLQEVGWGLANSHYPFLWSTGNSSALLEMLPREFWDEVRGRSCVVKWAPQQEVLGHESVGAFWTHGGWNSTLEGISEGVPMICSPFFGDQTVNGRWISDVWQIGIRLENINGFERGEIEKAIRDLMGGKKMKERVEGLKNIAKGCLELGGSSWLALEGLSKYILNLC